MGRWLFDLVLRLMPRDFRSEYGEEVRRVAEERWEERGGGAGPSGLTGFWVRESWALARAGASVRRHDARHTGGMTMTGWFDDLRLALRSLARRPGFAVLTVCTLALGIGASTAMFSAVQTLVLRPLPYGGADRIAVMFNRDLSSGALRPGVSAANTRDMRDASTLFEAVAVADPWSLDLQTEGRTESLRSWAVGRGFFQALGTEAALGRVFTDDDYADGATNRVVMSHRTWATRFGADPGIVGTTLTFEGTGHEVLGVLPADFRFPDAAEMWIPRPDVPWDDASRSTDYLTGVVRLADGVTLDQARAEAGRMATVLREAYPRPNANLDLALVPLREHLFGSTEGALGVLVAAVAFLLLIACANVAGLMLARGAQRERDFALRGALGAARGRLVSHVSGEALVIAGLGGVLGVGFAYAGVYAIRRLGPSHLPRIDQLQVDATVLAFAGVVAILCAVMSGVAPSLRLARPDLRGVLGEARGSAGRGSARARARLVVTQVSCAVVLLFGAGLLLRSFGRLLDRDLGFATEGRAAVQVFAYDYDSDGARRAFLDAVAEEMGAIPGVSGVAMTTSLPAANDGTISNIDINVPLVIEGRDPVPEGQEPQVAAIHVSPGYFPLLGTGLVVGRDFTDADDAGAAPVIIVNETLARRHFGEEEAVGARILVRYGGESNRPVMREIVGVVRDVRPLGHASDPRPEAYFPLDQFGSGSITFLLRTEADPALLLTAAREAIWRVNPAQAVWGAVTVEGLVSEWLVERRFTLFLLTTFSVVALLLSAIGLYGVVSFSVERRRAELGVRRALGGPAHSLVSMVIGEGARLAAVGLGIGLVAAWYLSRFIRGMLFETEPGDPLTLVGLGLLVFVIALVASGAPALRAMRVDPVSALRSD